MVPLPALLLVVLQLTAAANAGTTPSPCAEPPSKCYLQQAQVSGVYVDGVAVGWQPAWGCGVTIASGLFEAYIQEAANASFTTFSESKLCLSNLTQPFEYYKCRSLYSGSPYRAVIEAPGCTGTALNFSTPGDCQFSSINQNCQSSTITFDCKNGTAAVLELRRAIMSPSGMYTWPTAPSAVYLNITSPFSITPPLTIGDKLALMGSEASGFGRTVNTMCAPFFLQATPTPLPNAGSGDDTITPLPNAGSGGDAITPLPTGEPDETVTPAPTAGPDDDVTPMPTGEPDDAATPAPTAGLDDASTPEATAGPDDAFTTPSAPTPTPFTTEVCASAAEWSTLKIKCPHNAAIRSVKFASYGLPEGECPASKINGSCHASGTLRKVSKQCVGKAECSLSVTNKEFGDPCAGDQKVLTVSVACGVPTPVPDQSGGTCSTAQAHGAAVLSCPAGYKMSRVSQAVYGLVTGSCAKTLREIGDCSMHNVSVMVAAQCLGKRQCIVGIKPSEHERCPALDKNLAVRVICSPVSPPETESGGTCGLVRDAGVLELQCGAGEIIVDVPDAIYGMVTGTCAVGFTANKCRLDVSEVVARKCIGKRKCSVYAWPSSLGGDPCYGVVKALAANVTCGVAPPLTDGGAVGTAPDGKTLELSCPDGEIFTDVNSAFYGVAEGSWDTGFEPTGYCSLDDRLVEKAVSKACLGRSECRIPAWPTTFGSDPCKKVPKTLAVNASCNTSPMEQRGKTCGVALGGSTLELTCPSGQTVSSVAYATYGVLTGECGSTAAADTVTASPLCHADVRKKLSAVCVGKDTCSVDVWPTLAAKDPCPGIHKALAARVICNFASLTAH